ncbi:tetratricopeptide repeat protein [Streptomyces cyaneofuscatus]|uniref:tetratricopeptide repeat protein n=1 Tax=Streptomyces cyaneofuscatus TaxID=66883 RepID=UPI0037F369E0
MRGAPEDAAQFLFHIRGPAGVGKSTLARRLEGMAREERAVTAYVDEAATDAVEAMEAISAQFAQQGAALKAFDKLLATYRQRRHEADAGAAAALGAGPGADPTSDGAPGAGRDGGGPGASPSPSPSPSSMVASQIGLVGLGMIPGVGAFTGAVDPGHLAAGADRVKALLSARLRNHDDVQLVLSPLQSLVPVFLTELAEVARRHPWLVLFFDTYERSGPQLDTWLRDILVSDRYGEMPANVLVVLAGQPRLATRTWEDWLDVVTDWPLEVFTDAEARQLLTAKGVTDERVVDVIHTLSERLPVLVSTLAEARPAGVSDIGDPSGTAVERFLKWETDSVRRAAALSCALPQELDEDVYRAAVDGEASELFAWLRALPFVTDHAGHCRYHDVVRNAMLRLQRQQSPARWQQQHTRLADAFRERRTQVEEGTAPPEGWWGDDRWRAARLQETYHRLCAGPHAALPDALRELLDAYDHGGGTLRRWIQTLSRAGRDSGAPAIDSWGRRLLAAVEERHTAMGVLTLLLTHGGLDPQGRSLAHTLRGRDHRNAGRYDEAVEDYSQAIALVPDAGRARYGRGWTLSLQGQYGEALADLDRAVELSPGEADNFVARGLTYFGLRRDEEAVADYDRAIELDPGDLLTFGFRGRALLRLERHDDALASCGHALEGDPKCAYVLAVRGDILQDVGRSDEALADYGRAIELDPRGSYCLSGRAEILREVGRFDEALADYGRAIELDPRGSYYLSDRAEILREVGRFDEALVDYGRAIELDPKPSFVLTRRAKVLQATDRYTEAFADLDRAVHADPSDMLALVLHARALQGMGRYAEALAQLDRAREIDPSSALALSLRGKLHRLTERYANSLLDLDRAIELSPDDTFALNEHALSCHMTGRYEDAVSDLDRVIEIRPDNSWAHYEMAIVLRVLGRPGHERFLYRAAELLAAESDEDGQDTVSVARVGNRFLVQFALGHQSELSALFEEFLRICSTRGQIDELLADLSALLDALHSEGDRALPFVHRLREARTSVSPTAY